MKTPHSASLIPFLIPFWACSSPPTQTEIKSDTMNFPFSFCLVPEMEHIPELNTWPLCTTKTYAEETKNLQAEWKNNASWVASQINPEIVSALSRWAIKEMKSYKKIPPLTEVRFKPVREYRDLNKIVFEATADTLPTHSQIVTRWLKFYVIYDILTKTIVRVTVTIRGEKLE